MKTYNYYNLTTQECMKSNSSDQSLEFKLYKSLIILVQILDHPAENSPLKTFSLVTMEGQGIFRQNPFENPDFFPKSLQITYSSSNYLWNPPNVCNSRY